MKTKT